MDATKLVEVGTNHGLKLECVVAAALDAAGLRYRKAWQYDDYALTPDFSIPDTDTPAFVIEITRVEARNVFQRKLLRYIQAVADVKAHFGPRCAAVNILFSDVSALPSSSVAALTSLFDINLFPVTPGHPDQVDGLRALSHELQLGSLASCDKGELRREIGRRYAKPIRELGRLLARKLSVSDPSSRFDAIWEEERERCRLVGPITQRVGERAYVRDALLRSFYLPCDVYRSFVQYGCYIGDAKNLSLLASNKIVRVARSLRGTRVLPEPPLASLVRQQGFAELRASCAAALEANETIKWHFRDLREPEWLATMVAVVRELCRRGRDALSHALLENARHGSFADIEHSRCWIADVLAEVIGATHNAMNRAILQSNLYTGRIPNPFNNLTMRSERFLHETRQLESMCRALIHVCYADQQLQVKLKAVDDTDLINKLFRLRLCASRGLHTFNPLEIALKGLARAAGFGARDLRIGSFLSDALAGRSRAGKFGVLEFHRESDGSRFWLTCIAVGPNYGSDHKADEWSARLRAATHTWRDGKVARGDLPTTVFVYDGNWSEKSLTKLRRAGWQIVCGIQGFREEVVKL